MILHLLTRVVFEANEFLVTLPPPSTPPLSTTRSKKGNRQDDVKGIIFRQVFKSIMSNLQKVAMISDTSNYG